MSSNIIFPRSKFLDEQGNISKEWVLWLQNPQFVTFNIIGTLAIGSGGTGIGTIPGAGQILIGTGGAYNLNTLTAGIGIGITNGSGSIAIKINDTAVTPSSYGNATSVATFTVNQQGQITNASNTPIAVTNSQVSGLGTMSIQNSNSVAITGGTESGVTITGDTIDSSPIGATTPSTVKGSTVQSVGAFGCNSKAVQTAFASGGSVVTTGATNAAPFGYTTAAQANAIVTLLNNIQAALVANGILS